jgi:subtilisin family serine protease
MKDGKFGVRRVLASSLLASSLFLQPAFSSELSFGTLQSWMHSDVGDAWNQGFAGSGASITFVDNFSGTTTYSGNLGDGSQRLTHGAWIEKAGTMLAPQASGFRHDNRTNHGAVQLQSGLNVMNLSYSMRMQGGYNVNNIGWHAREASLIGYARDGKAVVVKAAGNYKTAVDGLSSDGNQDYLNLALAGHQSTIFVGALSRNGSTSNPASLASYSNFAGNNTTIQNQFLVAGVEGSKTGLNGTSMAAPVVSAYAAIIGSKFTDANATQITNQLLTTARTDTIANYNTAIHGRGEASLMRALAPVSITGAITPSQPKKQVRARPR